MPDSSPPPAPSPATTAAMCQCGHDESQHESACWACRREGRSCLYFGPASDAPAPPREPYAPQSGANDVQGTTPAFRSFTPPAASPAQEATPPRRPAEYPTPEGQTPLCIHCWQTEEMHLAYSFRDGKRGCVGERHATTGFTAPAAPTPEASGAHEVHSGQTFAPWTPEQVALLNNYQTTSGWHPFTCGSGKCSHVALIAHENGWRCPSCDYHQAWAHNFMTRPWSDPRLWSPDAPAAAAPAREASSAPDWDRAVEVADEFVAALAVRNRGSGTEGPRTHTDAYAAWLHLTQVLAASRATVAALTAEREALRDVVESFALVERHSETRANGCSDLYRMPFAGASWFDSREAAVTDWLRALTAERGQEHQQNAGGSTGNDQTQAPPTGGRVR